MASKRFERIGNLAWAVVFLAGTVAGIYGILVVDRGGWGAWDWILRCGGLVVLAAAGVGLALPDRTHKLDAVATTARVIELDGFTPSYDQTPALAAAVAGLARADVTAAHILFHSSRDGAWGVREVVVRLCYDRYAAGFSERTMKGFLERTHFDPCWVLLRAYWFQQRGRGGDALADLRLATQRDPDDPTPFVMEVGLLGPAIDEHATRRLIEAAYAEALRRAPSLYEAHDQLLRALGRAGDPDAAAREQLALARRVAAAAPEGSDEAFLPAVAHALIYSRLAAGEDDAAARAHLAADGIAGEIALACRRSFDSPHYRITHRTYRMLHTAATLHAVIGDVPRLHGELVRAGTTFDLDLWSPFHASYPVKAFLAARKLAGL